MVIYQRGLESPLPGTLDVVDFLVVAVGMRRAGRGKGGKRPHVTPHPNPTAHLHHPIEPSSTSLVRLQMEPEVRRS